MNGCETDDGSPLVCSDIVHALVDFRPAHYCKEIITQRLGTYVDLSQFHGWISERAASNKVVIKASIILLTAMIIGLLN